MTRIRNRFLFFIFTLTLILIPTASVFAQEDASMDGSWVGDIASTLTVVFHIETADKKIGATFDCPSQSLFKIPVASISFDRNSFVARIETKGIVALYSGEFSADRKRISGTWVQNGVSQSLNLVKNDAYVYAAPTRPQEATGPMRALSRDVVLDNKKTGGKLAGTLVIPEGSGPFPAVVLVAGSGAHNRNEEVAGHKIFQVVAESLAQKGIASLRYDKRGVGGSAGNYETATTLDFADDAETAWNYLQAQPQINPNAVGILGHSEGGLIAPIVASRNPLVAFVVLFAAPGLPGSEVMTFQWAATQRASGMSEKDIAYGVSSLKELYEIAAKSGDETSLLKELEDKYVASIENTPSIPPQEKKRLEEKAEELCRPLLSAWFKTFLTLDPSQSLTRVKVPVLALNGSKDVQVVSKENLAAIKAALSVQSNSFDSVVEFPGLNHLFQHASTGNVDEYSRIEETVAPIVLSTVTEWIDKVVRVKPIVTKARTLFEFGVVATKGNDSNWDELGWGVSMRNITYFDSERKDGFYWGLFATTFRSSLVGGVGILDTQVFSLGWRGNPLFWNSMESPVELNLGFGPTVGSRTTGTQNWGNYYTGIQFDLGLHIPLPKGIDIGLTWSPVVPLTSWGAPTASNQGYQDFSITIGTKLFSEIKLLPW